jgi:hypothetical protein
MPETPEIPEELPLADEAAGEENAVVGGGSVGSAAFPQGLKPGTLAGAYGGTEVPPFQGESEVPPFQGESEATLSLEENAEERQELPMLEVHSPHESVHTLKDALIHIAIIVVGLLIAVGLDEIAEHIHHLHQVAETREALRQELAYNTKLFAQTTQDTRWETAEYKNDMLVFEYLQQHPGTPQQKLPGILMWTHGDNRYRYAAWRPPSRAASPP